MTGPIRVLIADDHAIVREGVRSLLETRQDMVLVGEAGDGVEAVNLARSLHPDVILLDLMMPRMDGIEAITAIKGKQPECRILVLTSFAEDEKLFPAMKAGALGYLLKDSSPPELLQAIREVYQGRASLHPVIALRLIHELHHSSPLPPTEAPLTEREIEVLSLVARGWSNGEIAGKLVISERTVGAHVSAILNKLQLANRTQAALYALRQGIAGLDDEAA